MRSQNGSNGHTNGHFSSNGKNEFSDRPLKRKTKDSEPSQFEFDIRILWSILWRHKYAIMGFTLMTMLVFGFVAYNLEPIYKSDGSILISESKAYSPPRGNGVSALLSSMYGIGRENKVADELQVLRSRTLSMEIAKKLMEEPIMENGRQYPVLWRDYPQDSTPTAQDTVAERIRKNVTFSPPESKESNLINITYESKSPLEAARMINLVMETYTDFSSQQNRSVASSAVQFLDEEKKRIQENLKDAEQKLRYFMDNEQLVELDTQTNGLIKRIADLKGELQSIKVKQVAASSAVKRYEERLENLTPQLARKYTEAVLPKLDRFQYELAELETEKMLMIARNPGLEQQQKPPAEFTKLNDKISGLKQKIAGLTEELTNKSMEQTASLGSSGADLAGKISDLQEELIRRKVEQNQYQAQEEVLEKRLQEEQAFFEKLPGNMIELARLKRDVEINEQLYRTVSEQHAEMKLWEQTRFGLGRPIDRGYVPQKPDGPNLLLFLIGGFFVGGIMGLGYTCLREYTDSTIHRVDQVHNLNLPVLGMIPKLKKTLKKRYGKKERAGFRGSKVSTKLVTLLNNPSIEAEAFRRLSNNVIHSRPDEDLQVLMTTSFGTNEGEAVITANLAVALAEMGKNVLLMETDYRRPVLHKMFGSQIVPGIMEFLSGESGLDAAIQHTVMPRLDLLTPGKEPSNPVFVNRSEAFTEMMKRLKKRYDHILFKSAPIGILTDSIPLIDRSNGVIVIGRFEKTREDELKQLILNLEDVNANILGVVLSSFKYKRSTDYHTGYSRSYRKAYSEYFSYQRNKEHTRTTGNGMDLRVKEEEKV